jgi:diamine N-acetyltransferase
LTIELTEIHKDNLREFLRLKVAPAQEKFVAPNAVSVAQAYFHRDTAWFRGISEGGMPVGFLMLSDDRAKQEYFLWRFMIDERFQGRGFGRRALERLFEHVKTLPGATSIGTSCVDAPGGPGPFYEALGFTYTGELDEGERVMRRPL